MRRKNMGVYIFKSLDVREIKQIVDKVLTAPVNNAFVEIIFSVMESDWRNYRSRICEWSSLKQS